MVLHLRVLCPSDRSDAVLAALVKAPGATNLARLPGAAIEPEGDVVLADVAREAADGVLRTLRALGVERTGAISMISVDTALGASIDRAEAAAAGSDSDAVVWDELTERTGADSTLSATYVTFLVVATLIAAVGLLIDSQVLIVGAMVLGPEFGPLAGIAVGLVQRRWAEVRLSARALLVGFPVAIVVTGLGVAALQAAGQVPQAYLEGHRPLTAFVASPDIFSVVVALLAGIAGTISLTAAKSSSLVGVFISVTTVPAAAEIGAGLVTGQPGAAAGATVQLLVNLVCIILAAVLTLLLQRQAWAMVHRRHGST